MPHTHAAPTKRPSRTPRRRTEYAPFPDPQAKAGRAPPPELERKSEKIQFLTTPSIARRARAVAYWTRHGSLAALLEHALVTEINRAEEKHKGPFADAVLPKGRRPVNRKTIRGSLTDVRHDVVWSPGAG